MRITINNKTILAIGAHPDDIEYWAGGTVLKMTESNDLNFVIVTDGGVGGQSSVRRQEQAIACQKAGVRELVFLDYPDSELEMCGYDLKRDLLKIILTKKPEIIFSFDPENQFCLQIDTHPDHRLLSTIVTDLALIYATLPAYIEKMKITQEPLDDKPELWLFNPKNPNHLEDITSYWRRKLGLLKVFKSQNLDFGRSKQEASILGQQNGGGFAEAFHRVNFCCKMK